MKKTCENCRRFRDDTCWLLIDIEEVMEQIWSDYLQEKIEWMELRAKYCRGYKYG